MEAQEEKVQDKEIPEEEVQVGLVQEKAAKEKESREKELAEKEFEEKDLQQMVMTRKKYSSTQLPDSLSFRIAILSPGEFDDVLTMTLEVRNLSEQDLDYEAISYCWSQGIGDAIEDTWDFHVKCGEDTFMVPRNLGRALRRLRYQDKQRRLWMDSVCIDQQSVEEKNVQVAMMGRIFAQARRVVVWLGEQDENTRSVYGTIRLLARTVSILASKDEQMVFQAMLTQQVSEVAGLRPVFRKEIQDMAEFLKKAWFERAWVYQESVLARETMVRTGSYEIAGNTIVSMVECGDQFGMSYVGLKPENLLALDRAYAMFSPLKKRSRFGSNFWQDLFWLLRARRGAKALDSRDIVYSLLGIAAGGNTSLIVPDYNQSWQQLYIWVAKRIIKETRLLDILGELTAVQGALGSASNSLPSWVPDWRIPLDEEANFNIDAHIKAGPKRRLFWSTGISEVELFEGEDLFSTKLKLRGIHVDIVESIQPSAQKTSWREFRQNLKEELYWPTQEPIRLAHIKTLSMDASVWDPEKPDYISKGAVFFVEDYEKYLEEEMGEMEPDIIRKMAKVRRKVFLTSRGFLGVAPDSVTNGDQLYLLPGAEYPVLLRRHPEHQIAYKIVGVCYIHGLMNGQGMKLASGRVDTAHDDPSKDILGPCMLHGKQVGLSIDKIVIN